MNHLLTFLYTKLSETQKPVYFEIAPSKTVFPYIVYKLPNSVNVESDRQDYTLQIDVWDKNTDTTALETLTDDIDKQLYKLEHLDTDQFLKFERESRLMIPDTDPKIKRRQLRYVVKQYER
jgi:hypothetical protein